ncbi:MAG: class IV adenylate cyclase [Candidatus Babeliales bacterium]
MKQELEVKIQITTEQLNLLHKWLDKNAKFIEQINHKEYYLNNPNDSFFFINADGKKDALRFFRIRLTDQGDSACYKNWHVDKKTGHSTHCDEIEIKLIGGMQMLKLMEAVGFTEQRVKEKNRKKYIFNNFEIVIDDIKNLGIFVEIELIEQIKNINLDIQKIYDLLRTIGIFVFNKQIAGCGKMERIEL